MSFPTTIQIDPIFWASLIQFRNCELEKPIDKECKYPGTPLTGQFTWSCQAGSFCLSATRVIPCTPGFYCPANAMERMSLLM